MFAFKRAITYPYGALLVTLAGVLAVVPAQSRSTTHADQAQRCGARVIELEAEVRALQEQVRQLSATRRDSTAALYPANSIRHPGAAAARTAIRTSGDACDPPYSFDQRGIKSYKSECLKADAPTAPCAIPYEFTAGGIKIYDPQCFETTPAQRSCDPPYAFDARGVKNYKVECL